MDWSDFEIDVRGRTSGEVRTLCPRCSHNRHKKPREKCLSVNVSEGVWNCHHCGWSGALKERRMDREPYRPNTKRKQYTKPKYEPRSSDEPSEKLLAWFAARGIPAEVVKRNGIEARTVWMSATGRKERVICFPYFRKREVVNVKYRTAEKGFQFEKGAELLLYGEDDIQPGQPLIFVEGELDKLAHETAGYRNCVSVPNGYRTNLDILASAESLIGEVPKIILAGDGDEPGRMLEAELIRRLGPERCWRVTWPEGCKDANDVLVKYSAEELRASIENASPVPINGAFEGHDLTIDVMRLYETGRPNGVDPGWDNLAKLYRPRPGEWSVVTGIPGSGKSAFVKALAVNLALKHNWQFVVFPAEELPPEENASTLIELWAGEPFSPGPTPRMDRDTVLRGLDWVHDHFVFLNPDEGGRGLDAILETAKSFVLRRGINGLIIDPWNELEQLQSAGQSETQYIGESLIKIRQFSRIHKVHTWVVAHPVKLYKSDDGNYPVPTLYDIAGSAHWFNKADFGITIWRNKTDDSQPVDIHIQKVRFRWCGQIGLAQLYYDKVTGRYREAPPPQPGVLIDSDVTESIH